MTLTLTDLFGTGATNNAGNLSINLASLATATGFNGNVSNASASQIATMLVMYWTQNTANLTTDPTKLITASSSFQTIVLRGEVSQIANSYTVNIHTPNANATLDPDNVV